MSRAEWEAAYGEWDRRDWPRLYPGGPTVPREVLVKYRPSHRVDKSGWLHEMAGGPGGHCLASFDEYRLVTIIKRNGKRVVKILCERCAAVGGELPHSIIKASADYPPVLRSWLDGTPCERCGSTEGVEDHHWAPKAIFGIEEADYWPMGCLCPPCHQLWHKTMNAVARQARVTI